MNSNSDRWERLLRAAARLQGLVPGAILVGGTAAALHVSHRISLDADHVVPDLQSRFDELLETLEGQEDWTTARTRPPKLILGDFEGVETGLRQIVRTAPLETVSVVTPGGSVVVPTPEEMLRIKGWLIIARNAVRDFVDVAALASWLGQAKSASALRVFDACYQDIYKVGASRDVSPLLQLARQLAEPKPHDLHHVDLADYKGIVPPWDDWANIERSCQALAVVIIDHLTA